MHVQILVMGQRIGSLDRNGPQSVVLTETADKIARQFDGYNITMDIIVEAVGRVNTGVDFDLKGLVDPLVLLNSKTLDRHLNLPSLCLKGLDCVQVKARFHSGGCDRCQYQG
jgi:hypothetical protein